MYNLNLLYNIVTKYTSNILFPINNIYNYINNIYQENDLIINNNFLKLLLFASLIINLMQYLNYLSDRHKILYLETTIYKYKKK